MRSSDPDFAARLDAFLATRGATRQLVVSAVGEAFGTPLLVVATGSILQGFGNQKSDLDISVIVDHAVTRLPVPAHRSGILLDATYFGVSEVKMWGRQRFDGTWPPTGAVTREQWRRRVMELTFCTRFRDGVVLSARDPWDRWIAEFREPWLVSQVAEWWRLESLRRWLGGRWLSETKPVLAAQRRFEAILAILEMRAATCGQSYFGAKWLAEKLRIIDDREGLEVLNAFIRMPVTQQEAREYSARCEEYLTKFSERPGERAIVQLWYAPGVKVREIGPRIIVSRWNLRTNELGTATPRMPQLDSPIWEGNLDTIPPPDMLQLFASDMTWLSITTRPI
jgi:hypothetical protein